MTGSGADNPNYKGPHIPPNPSGLCQCGCGEKAPISPVTRISKGYVAGEAVRFIAGHNRRVQGFEGENHPMWRGGRIVDRYIRVLAPGDPEVDAKGYVYEHRLVARELVGGRVLRADEHVHHINGDRHDNRVENLQILSSEEHSRLHMTEMWAKAKARGEYLWGPEANGHIAGRSA